MLVCLYRGRSATSRLIRWFTRGVYSHASCLDPETGSEFESWKGGVTFERELGEGHLERTPIDLFAVENLSAEQAAKVREFLESKLGTPYDFRGIFQFLTRRVQARPELRFFCSELVFAAFEEAKAPLLLRCQPFVVHPTLLSYSPRLTYLGTVLSGKGMCWRHLLGRAA
jgi:uncharacterized protein YycO